MNYRIVVSDLDGTLLNSSVSVSDENLAAIRKMSSLSVHFVPSSGRTLSEMPKGIYDNPDIRYIIYSNGAVVYDKQTEKRLCMGITNEDSAKLFDILYCYDVHITVRHGGKCYVDSGFQKDSDYKYYNVCEPHKEVVGSYGIQTDNFKELCSEMDNIEVLSVFFHDDSERVECKKRILEIGSLIVADAWNCNIEISSRNAGKGNALVKLANMLGADMSETIAVGDSGNDITMLKAAGLGLAVRNASDNVKEWADEIICSNEEHIAKYIFTHYIGNGKL